MQQSNIKHYKVAFVGNNFVGKTSLIHRMAQGEWLEKQVSGPAMELHQIKGQYNNSTYTLNVYDIAGVQKNHEMVLFYLKQAEAIVLAFDLSDYDYDQNLMPELEYWMQAIKTNASKGVVTYIVGCKGDKIVLDGEFFNKINHIIEHAKMAQMFRADQRIFLTSSKTGEEVNDLQDTILSGLSQIKKKQTKPIVQTEQIKKEKPWYKRAWNSVKHGFCSSEKELV